jgi:hypothetical protein
MRQAKEQSLANPARLLSGSSSVGRAVVDVDHEPHAGRLPYPRPKVVDIRDRVVPLIATAIVGIVALAFLMLTLLNGIGAVLAHYDSQRYHKAQSCDSPSADKSNCILTQSATLEDIFGGISFSCDSPTETPGF